MQWAPAPIVRSAIFNTFPSVQILMDSILHQLSLGTLSESFLNERIDLGVALSMSDSASADLGVNMIGNRI